LVLFSHRTLAHVVAVIPRRTHRKSNWHRRMPTTTTNAREFQSLTRPIWSLGFHGRCRLLSRFETLPSGRRPSVLGGGHDRHCRSRLMWIINEGNNASGFLVVRSCGLQIA
jgi:hypothetical protein